MIVEKTECDIIRLPHILLNERTECTITSFLDLKNQLLLVSSIHAGILVIASSVVRQRRGAVG